MAATRSSTVEQARRDVFRARARLKRAEVRAGVHDRAAAAGDAVTTLMTDKVAPAVHDAFADHVVPAVHDVVVDKVAPAVRDTFTDKVAPAAQKAARRGAKRSAQLSREAAARLAETDAAQEARRRAEGIVAAAAGKQAKTRRRRWPLALGLLGGALVLARRATQKAHEGLPLAEMSAVPSTTATVDLTAEEQAARDAQA